MPVTAVRGGDQNPRGLWFALGGTAAVLIGLGGLLATIIVYNTCKIEVENGQQAVLIRKTGLDLEPGMDLAPPPRDGQYYKGVQTEGPKRGVLTEGRYFYNPYHWAWEITPQFVVPNGKFGVRVSLVGEELPNGQVLAHEGQKGIQAGYLAPGRYSYNPYAEMIELHDPVIVPAGYRGVVTLLAGKPPKDPNVFLVDEGERGVQRKTLEPGLYPVNPYERRISLVDCRSKRFNLNQDGEMDFLSADGFPVTLDGVIEFRVIAEQASEVFVKYNEDQNGDEIDEEIIAKIITPESRSLCRTGGSKLTGGQFIAGNDREDFQRNLVRSLSENCKKQGIEILAVAITSIQPPEEIAAPVRLREVAKQELNQFNQEKLQQLSEAQLKVQTLLAEQKKKVVEAEQAAIVQTTKADQEQQVAVTLAEQKLKVAETNLEASRNKAKAIISKAEAEADVIRFKNTAELAGLATRVEAFGGDGHALAENLLIQKLAPSFKTILSNSDGPIMNLFNQFTDSSRPRSPAFFPREPELRSPRSNPSSLKPGVEPRSRTTTPPAVSPGSSGSSTVPGRLSEKPTRNSGGETKPEAKPATGGRSGADAPKDAKVNEVKPTRGTAEAKPELPSNPFGPGSEESNR